MPMRYGRGRNDEQDILQQLMGGGDGATRTMPSQNVQTQPVGPAIRADEESAAPAMPSGIEARKALGGYGGTGRMLGFNTAMDYPDDKAANSMKNTFGRIASRYRAAPSSIDAIMADPDFQRFFPGAKKVEGGAGDKIDFGGMLSDFESGVPVGVVDVGGAFDPNADAGEGWTWQDLVNDGGGDPMAAMGGGGGGMGLEGMDPASLTVDQLSQSDTLEQILRALSQQGGQDEWQRIMGGA